MADLTTDATAANADTLSPRSLTENLQGGGGGGTDFGETEVVKSTDEAIRMRQLTTPREVESKKPESDISPVEVPKEFICTLSNAIMIEPVIIASGETYEKRYITEWLKHESTCPKSKEVLPNHIWMPNHLINELITRWCLANKFDRQKPSDEIVTELLTVDIESLLHRISSPSSDADQTEAARELTRQTKKFENVRDFFVAELPDSIYRLLTPLSILGDKVDSNPEFLENIVTSLFNMSTFEKNKTVIAENPDVIPLLTKSLKQGTVLTRRTAVTTFASLSDIDSNRTIIANSEALKALIDVIEEEDDLSATIEAICTVYIICIDSGNRNEAISAGVASVVTKKIKAGRNVDELLPLLALISPHERVMKEMDNLGLVHDLFGILRKASNLESCENALTIVYNMYLINRERSKLQVFAEEEKLHRTFTKHERQGSNQAVRIAQGILEWIRIFVAEPQRA